jgi:hypothetical protein
MHKSNPFTFRSKLRSVEYAKAGCPRFNEGGAYLLALLFLIGPTNFSFAQDVPPPKPKPPSPSTTQKSSTTQQSAYSLLVRVDIDCKVSVDDSDPVAMRAGKARRFKSGPGQHLIQAETVDGNVKNEQSVEQKEPQVIVEVNLGAMLAQQAEQQRQAQARQEEQQRQAQARQEDQQRRAAAIQARIDRLVGHWIRVIAPPDMGSLTHSLNLSRGQGGGVTGSLVVNLVDYKSGNATTLSYSVTVMHDENTTEDADPVVSYKYQGCTGFCNHIHDKSDHTGHVKVKSDVQVILSDDPFVDKSIVYDRQWTR